MHCCEAACRSGAQGAVLGKWRVRALLPTNSGCKWVGKMSLQNGIIRGIAMAEKRLEKGKLRYSAAYPTGRERFKILPRGFYLIEDRN